MSEENNHLEGLEEDYTPDLITLEDEAGEEHVFEVLDAADLGDVHYLALVPFNEDPNKMIEEDAEMIIMRRSEDENGEEMLDIVEEEDELVQVSGMFLERLEDVYNISLEDLKSELGKN